MKKSMIMIVVSICLAVSFNVSAKKKSDKHLVLNLVGTGEMYERLVPDIDGDLNDDPAFCFDVELFDLKKNKKIGKATDCLSKITPAGGNLEGITLVGTTYFDMGKKGTLITRGNTTVQPALQSTVTPKGQDITHITGASSAENAVIMGGTRKFKNATGTSRLSGMVNLANFGGMVDDPITFDCIFIIDLD